MINKLFRQCRQELVSHACHPLKVMRVQLGQHACGLSPSTHPRQLTYFRVGMLSACWCHVQQSCAMQDLQMCSFSAWTSLTLPL